MPLKHRYVQMFYYSTLVAVPFGLHDVFRLARRKVLSLTHDNRVVPVVKYLGKSVIMLLFLCVLIVFWQVSCSYRRRLLNPGGKYRCLLSAIADEMTTNNKEQIEIFGTTRSLRAVSLFTFLPGGHRLAWHGVSHEDLELRLEQKQVDYSLMDNVRETADLGYLKGQRYEDRKAVLDSILRITTANYHTIYSSKDFSLFKSCDAEGKNGRRCLANVVTGEISATP
jgi:hypothetical protein